MFRKIVLSSLAALGLMAAVAAPSQAYPHYQHYNHYHYQHSVYRHYHAWPCRTFHSYADACSWMNYQRQCGCQCYCEWQGPMCCVYDQ
jgi:hypothetical protein